MEYKTLTPDKLINGSTISIDEDGLLALIIFNLQSNTIVECAISSIPEDMILEAIDIIDDALNDESYPCEPRVFLLQLAIDVAESKKISDKEAFNLLQKSICAAGVFFFAFLARNSSRKNDLVRSSEAIQAAIEGYAFLFIDPELYARIGISTENSAKRRGRKTDIVISLEKELVKKKYFEMYDKNGTEPSARRVADAMRAHCTKITCSEQVVGRWIRGDSSKNILGWRDEYTTTQPVK